MSKVQVDKVVNLSDDGAPQLTYGAELPVGYGLTGAGGLNITGVVTAASAVFSGNVTIGGTLTYEDVTNIDVVGVSTFAGRMNVNSSALFNEGLSVTAGVTTIAGNVTVDSGSNGMIDFGDINGSAYGRLYADSTGTFIGSKSNQKLVLRTNNSEVVTITTAGRMGVGDNSPDTALHVKSADNILATFESTDADSLIEFKDNGTSDSILLGALGGDDLMLRCDAGDIRFYVANNTEKARITGVGSFAIGNTSPTEKFEVHSGNIAIVGGAGYKIDTHPLLTYASFVLGGGNYACRLGSTGSSTIRHTQIYGGGSHIATFDGVNTRLGIGVTNPEGSITVARNEASGYIASFRGVHASNSAQIIIDSPADNNTRPSSIDLANAGTIYWSLGQAYASHTSKAFHIATSKLQANDTGAKLTISVGGDVGIGTFSPGRKLHLHEASSGQILQQITNDTTGVGSGDGFHIGLNSSEEVLIQNKENTKMTLYTNDNARITIANDGHCVFSNSIALGGETATANRLDDYEEGDFTPTLGSGTPTSVDGKYTKVGNICVAAMSITFQTITTGDHVVLGGLPFTAAAGRPGAAILRYSDNANAYKIAWHVSSGTTTSGPYFMSGGGIVTYNNVSTSRFDLTFVYRTA